MEISTYNLIAKKGNKQMKRERFRFAGQTVKVKKDIQKFGGADFTIEDYWENVNGGTS